MDATLDLIFETVCSVLSKNRQTFNIVFSIRTMPDGSVPDRPAIGVSMMDDRYPVIPLALEEDIEILAEMFRDEGEETGDEVLVSIAEGLLQTWAMAQMECGVTVQ